MCVLNFAFFCHKFVYSFHRPGLGSVTLFVFVQCLCSFLYNKHKQGLNIVRKHSIQRHPFWSYPAGLIIADPPG